MKFFFCVLSSLVFAAIVCQSAILPLVERQAPNQLYAYYPADMTGSFNVTAWVLPIDKTVAQSMAGSSYQLLDSGLSSSVIGANKHPLLIQVGYYYDIRQQILGLLPLQVPQLSVVEVYLPYVDYIGTGAPFRRSVTTYMDQLIPALVGGLTQFHFTNMAYFDPAHAAYKSAGSSLAFTAGLGLNLLFPLLGGPMINQVIFQSLHSRTSTSAVPVEKFQEMMNQPYYTQPGAQCNKVTLLFNSSNADPSFVNGNVQVFSPILASTKVYDPSSSQIGYGWTVGAQWHNPSGLFDCSTLV